MEELLCCQVELAVSYSFPGLPELGIVSLVYDLNGVQATVDTALQPVLRLTISLWLTNIIRQVWNYFDTASVWT